MSALELFIRVCGVLVVATLCLTWIVWGLRLPGFEERPELCLLWLIAGALIWSLWEKV